MHPSGVYMEVPAYVSEGAPVFVSRRLLPFPGVLHLPCVLVTSVPLRDTLQEAVTGMAACGAGDLVT